MRTMDQFPLLLKTVHPRGVGIFLKSLSYPRVSLVFLTIFTTQLYIVCVLAVQLHFEDSLAPFGDDGAARNYRPDGTPTKVGAWMLLVKGRCMVFLPGNRMSFDEGTARYNGRMSRLKHKQSRYKPYDGIRIYMLNDSATGLMF